MHLEDIKYKISIIVPAYNCEKYISSCLNSIINQGFDDFEVIVINDGSCDKTGEIALEYTKKDKRIKYFSQENKGPSSARNLGIKEAKGEYILFVDCDDWLNSDYLQKLYSAIIKSGSDIAVSNLIRKGKYKHKHRFNYKEEKTAQDLARKIELLKVPLCCYVTGKLYKKELVENHLFIDGMFFEDIMWLPEVIKKSKKTVTVPEAIYYYRINNSSIVKKIPNKKKQQDLYNARKYIVKFFKENNLNLGEKEKNITKFTYYFLKIPILKIKEKGCIETYLLFGFLPIFIKNV